MVGRPHSTLKRRLFAKVLIRPTDPAGCWEWNAARTKTGYGKIYSMGRWLSPHRVVFEMYHGEIPAGLDVDHTCRNRGCVSPDHLRTATRSQNMQNVGPRRENKSGYRGVWWDPKKKRFQAKANHQNRTVHFGEFATAEEANEAAIAGRLRLFTHNELDRV